ncbi:MAG: DRTGG domain-containing protein [Candidatus Geothermincolia bacterium]
MVTMQFLAAGGQSGIHSICIGVCMKLKEAGYKVGFMKPLGFRLEREQEMITDADAKFLRKLLEMEEPLELINPVFLTPSLVSQALAGEGEDLPAKIASAFQQLSRGRDVMILQGALTASQGALLGISGYDIHNLLGTQVVIIDRYDDSHLVDNVLVGKNRYGDSLLGVIYNMVPKLRMGFLDESVKPFLEGRGIPLLGRMPEDKILKSTSVEDLATTLHAQVLSGREHMDSLIEDVMVGSMGAEHALIFFRRRKNHAIVTGGDRSDMQLAALEANAKCIILSGNLYPSALILARAEEKGVPMLLVEEDTLAAAEKAELLIRTARTHEPRKLEHLSALMKEHVDLERLYRLSGLER